MKKAVFVTGALVFMHVLLFSQTNITIPDVQQASVPSPQAMQFQKYGDYPVSYSTGIPDISVPLYTIKTGHLTLPINLSYHSAGFKPAEDNGIVGLGWSLNAGGRISRTMFGKPDELSASPNPVRNTDTMNMSYLDNQNYITYLANNTTSGLIDEDLDLFYYNLPSGSGKFILKNNGDGTRTPVLTKYRPIKIKSNTSTYNGVLITYFEITDEDGITYRYGTSLTDGFSAIENSNPDRHNAYLNNNSSWMLTEMISADKTDTIHFKYYGPNLNNGMRGTRTDQGIVTGLLAQYTANCSVDQNTCINAAAGPFYATSLDNISYSSHFQCTIKEIDFKDGKVLFNYAGNSFYNSVSMTLNQVIIQNLAGNTLQSYQLAQSYFGVPGNTNPDYFKLDSLKLFDSKGTYINNYSFGYYNSTSTSVPQGVTENLSIDYWGFYNGANNSMLLPNWPISTYQGVVPAGNANRESDENSMKTFILNYIKYPTGGSTTFEFEGNRIMGNPPTTPHITGGLRIRRITDSAANGSVTFKSFKYGQANGDESGYGVLLLSPFQGTSYFTQLNLSYLTCNCTNDPNTPNYVNNITTYSSGFTDGSGIFETNPMFYTNVAEYDGYDAGSDNGKTVYTYSLPSSSYYNSQFQRHLALGIDWYGGELTSKLVYKNVNGSYSLLDEEDYTYQKRQTDSLIGTKVIPYITGYSNYSGGGASVAYAYEQLFDHNYVAFKFWNYAIPTGVNQLVQKSHTVYSDYGNITTVTNYTFGTNHNWPLVTSTTDSKGYSLAEQNYHPTDLSLTGVAEDARTKLITANILSPVLRHIVLRNNVQQYLQNNNYKDFGSGVPLEESVDIQLQNNPLEKRIKFLGYDSKSNLLSQQKVNDLVYNSIWDYNSEYITAQVSNAGSAAIAYTSFEADGSGNWTINSTARDTTTWAITGKKSYVISNGSITFSGLSTTDTVVVSYWSTSGKDTVSGSISGKTITGKTVTINGKSWTYYEHLVTGQTTVTVSNAVGGNIDELRLYPQYAQMTTYTYTPLIGLTCKCDVNNRVSYYEYDALGRLKDIKDQDGNILKTYDYHFKQ